MGSSKMCTRDLLPFTPPSRSRGAARAPKNSITNIQAHFRIRPGSPTPDEAIAGRRVTDQQLRPNLVGLGMIDSIGDAQTRVRPIPVERRRRPGPWRAFRPTLEDAHDTRDGMGGFSGFILVGLLPCAVIRARISLPTAMLYRRGAGQCKGLPVVGSRLRHAAGEKNVNINVK